MRITTEDIRVGFHTRQILKGISIDSGNKELVGIIGPNGSGKSTLLKCIYRVLKADSGAVYLDGDELYSMNAKSSAKKMAVVAQHNYYNFDFSVREVVLMGRAPHKKALERDNAKDYRGSFAKGSDGAVCGQKLFYIVWRRTAESHSRPCPCTADPCTDSG